MFRRNLLHPYLAMKTEVERSSTVLITGSRIQFSNAGSYCSYMRNIEMAVISLFSLYQSCSVCSHRDCFQNTRHVCFEVLGTTSA
jgi:hypothetical protein